MYTIRRKYAAGGDVWLADCDTEQKARDEARIQSAGFEHGAVYVVRRSSQKSDVICCFSFGLTTSWYWWSVPNVLPLRIPAAGSATSISQLPRRL